MIDYLSSSWPTILQDLLQHLVLAIVPIVIGLIIALPLGYLAVRFGWIYQPFMSISSVLYAIPSLALFVLLPTILGTKILSPINIVVALTVYSVALLLRVIADALLSVDPIITQAATAMGYRRVRRLFGVELPIALPVILAGLRVATISNISLVSIGAIIGIGSLGSLFTQGMQLDYLEPIIVGIVLSVALAAACDLIIVAIQRRLTGWNRAGTR